MLDFNTTAIGNSLTKSYNSQTFSFSLRQQFYSIALPIAWIILRNCQQRFSLNVFNVFIFKNKSSFFIFINLKAHYLFLILYSAEFCANAINFNPHCFGLISSTANNFWCNLIVDVVNASICFAPASEEHKRPYQKNTSSGARASWKGRLKFY